MTATTTTSPRCPTPGCTPVTVTANRRARRLLARTGHNPAHGIDAHSDHCPFAGRAIPGWQAVGRVRSPFGGARP